MKKDRQNVIINGQMYSFERPQDGNSFHVPLHGGMVEMPADTPMTLIQQWQKAPWEKDNENNFGF